MCEPVDSFGLTTTERVGFDHFWSTDRIIADMAQKRIAAVALTEDLPPSSALPSSGPSPCIWDSPPAHLFDPKQEPEEPQPAAAPLLTVADAFTHSMARRYRNCSRAYRGVFVAAYDRLGVPKTTQLTTLTPAFVQQLVMLWKLERGRRKGSSLSARVDTTRLALLKVFLEAADLPPHGIDAEGWNTLCRPSERAAQKAL